MTNYKLQIKQKSLLRRSPGEGEGVTGGFTLIELLIVIAIISILAAVLITILNPAKQQQKARDSNRRQFLVQLASAMETCYVSEGAWANCDTILELCTNNYLEAAVTSTKFGTTAALERNLWHCASGCVAVNLEAKTATYCTYNHTVGQVVESTTDYCGVGVNTCGDW